LGCLSRSIENAADILAGVISKAHFWERFAGVSFNERQIKITNLLLDNFEGKLTSSKWAKIANCSQDTAHRDILDLIEKGVLLKNPEGGRNTSYAIYF
jgi:Fic family protein